MIRNWKKAAAVIGALAVTATVIPALSSPASAAVLKPGISSGNGVTPAVANGFPGCSTGTPYQWNGKSPGTQTTSDGVQIKLTRTGESLPGDDSRYVKFEITGAKMVQAIVKTDVFFAGFITESTVYSYSPGVASDEKIHPPTASNTSPYKVDGYRFCYVRNQADLSITKSASTASQNPGAAVTYTLTATNNGPDAATGVKVTDTLPAGLTFVSSPDGGTSSGGVVTWVGLTVPVNGSRTLTAVVKVDANAPGGATLTNNATVIAGNESDPIPGNNSASSPVTVNSLVDVEVTKTVSDETPNEGETVAYTITATNVAGNAPATGVTITDVLPAGVTLEGTATATSGDFEAGVWSIPTLAPGAPETLTIPVTITGAGGTIIDNIADLGLVDQLDTNDGNDSAMASLRVNQAPVAGFEFEVDSLVDLLKVNFTDQSSDPDGTIVSWSWDFGDLASTSDTSTAENPTYTYPASGEYSVTLTVTDDDGGTNSISQDVEVRFEEAVDCGELVPADDVATTGPAAQAATFTRGDNNTPGGLTDNCEDIGVTLQIDEDGVFLDKGTVGILTGAPQDVNSKLLIDWTPVATSSPTLTADLARDINFFPDTDITDPNDIYDIFVPVQWCLSSVVIDGTLTAEHPLAPPELADAPGFTDGEVPWCLVSNTETLNANGTISQVQLYHGKGDPRMR